MNLASLIVKLVLDNKAYTKVVNQEVKNAKTWSSKLATNVRKGFMPMFAIIGSLGVAFGAFTANGIKNAAQLEAQVSGIAAVMGKTKQEVEPLNALIRDLGLDPNLKVEAFEAADAIEFLARNGLAMAEILDGAARSTVLLANAVNADFGQAADIATDVMSIFNIAAKDMNVAVNGITGVINNSKFSINDYQLAFANAAKGIQAANLPFDQFNAILAATASNFKSGQTAGTAISNMLLGLVPRTEKAAEFMNELGLITAEGGNRFFTASGEMKDIADVALILQETFGALSAEQRTLALTTIFGRDAMSAISGVIQLVGKNGENAKEVIEGLYTTIGDTDAAKSAETRMDNLAGVLEILKGVIDAAGIELGQSFLPLLRAFADRALVFAEITLPKLSSAFQTVSIIIGDMIVSLEDSENIFGLVANALEAAEINADTFAETMRFLDRQWESFKKTIEPFLKDLFDLVAGFVTWKDVLIGLGIALATIVIPALITLASTVASVLIPVLAIIAAVAVLRTAWEEDWLGIRTTLTTAWEETIQPTLKDIKEWFQTDGLDALKEFRNKWVDEYWPKISEVLSSEWEKMKGDFAELKSDLTLAKTTLQNLHDQWGIIWPEITRITKNNVDDIKFRLSIFAKNVKVGTDAGKDLRNQWAIIWPAMRGVLANNWALMKLDLVAFFTNLLNVIETLQNLRDQWGIIWPEIQQILSDVWEDMKEIFFAITDWFSNLADDLLGTEKQWGTFWDNARNKVTEVWGVISQIFDDIRGFFAWLTNQTFTVDVAVNMPVPIPEVPNFPGSTTTPGDPRSVGTPLGFFPGFAGNNVSPRQAANNNNNNLLPPTTFILPNLTNQDSAMSLINEIENIRTRRANAFALR